MSNKKILVVEDERHLAEGIQLNLESESYVVYTTANGREADELLIQEQFDLVILDVMLPGIDGFEVCRRLRARDDRTPVIFLTARKSPEDRVTGLDIGGDDYLQKPFHVKELISRVHAILRRRAWITADLELKILQIGSYEVDLIKMEAAGPTETHSLSRRECLILKLLAERGGGAVSRNEILDRAWGNNQYPSDRTVDNFIVRLRQKLEVDPADPRHILTVRSVGYRLV